MKLGVYSLNRQIGQISIEKDKISYSDQTPLLIEEALDLFRSRFESNSDFIKALPTLFRSQYSIRAIGEKSGKKSKVVQDASELEPLDLLIEKSELKAYRYIKQWFSTIGSWLDSQDSLQSAQVQLNEKPELLYDRLDGKGFERIIEQSMLLADLVGRDEIIDEVKRTDSLSDLLPIRNDAVTPDWLKQPFQKAIAAFRQKLVIPNTDYKSIVEGYHDWAFTVSGVTRADLIEDTKWLVDKALTDGNSFDTFKDQWTKLIGRKGWQPSEHRMRTIFETNIRSANGTGRGQQMLDPDVAKRRPYILWRWRDSPNPRPHHQALHNKAIAADSKFWQSCRTPAGFGCKCSSYAVSEAYCKRNGIEILDNPPDPDTIAEPGFRYPLNGLSDKQRQQQKEEYVEKVDAKLRDKILGK